MPKNATPKPPNLLRKVLLDGKWLMLPVARFTVAAGAPVYDLSRVLHRKQPVVVTSGTFYLEYRDPHRRRRAIGEDHAQVKAALSTQASVLELRAKGIQVEDAPQIRSRAPRPEGKTIREVVKAFIDTPSRKYRPKSYAKYRNALENFSAWTRRTHVVEVERDDIKAFVEYQARVQELNVSTAIDKAVAVAKVLRDAGAPIVMRKGDWPRVTKKKRKIYKPEVLKKLFAAADQEERDLFLTFLFTGMREQEVSNLGWPDFDEDDGSVSVTAKHAFAPKNYEERTVYVCDELVTLLRRRRKRLKIARGLIFPTTTFNEKRGAPGGQHDGHMLRKLKKLADRAGLNCGQCEATLDGKRVSCATHAVCKEFGLHKFRHTYATQLLRDGMDLVSLQQQLGHKDLDSTKEYLNALEPVDMRMKVRRSSLAKKYV